MNKISGNIVAIVTPMQKSCNSIDYKSFQNLIEWYLDAKVDGIIVAGSTGEAPTLTTTEWIKLLEIALQTVGNQIPIIAGSGTNCTKTTIEKTLLAADIGAAAALIVTPYYNKPTQLGLKSHFSEIANKTNLPIILYNVPSRTGCDLIPDTVISLSKIDNIIGIKEATGKLDRVNILRKNCGDDFILLSGDDATFVDFMELGGDGVISVTANICPGTISKICNLMLQSKLKNSNEIKLSTANSQGTSSNYLNIRPQSDGEFNPQGLINQAKHLNLQLSKLHTELMVQTNPIPVKWLLAYLGKIEEAYRLPLTTLETPYHQSLLAAYRLAISTISELTI